MKAIVTVIGKDKIGIIAAVSAALSECSVNILDISQTILQDYFTMIMLTDTGACKIPFPQLQKQLNELGEQVGVEIRIQHQDIFNSMHRI